MYSPPQGQLPCIYRNGCAHLRQCKSMGYCSGSVRERDAAEAKYAGTQAPRQQVGASTGAESVSCGQLVAVEPAFPAPIATRLRELADLIHESVLVDIAREVETLERELAEARRAADDLLKNGVATCDQCKGYRLVYTQMHLDDAKAKAAELAKNIKVE